jgi:hypothetical protein
VNSNQAHQIVPEPTSNTVDANQISSALETIATLQATFARLTRDGDDVHQNRIKDPYGKQPNGIRFFVKAPVTPPSAVRPAPADTMVRTALYEAANILLSRVTRFSALKRWGMEVAKRRGLKRAKVALARKMALMHDLLKIVVLQSMRMTIAFDGNYERGFCKENSPQSVSWRNSCANERF